jgi:excisionase family DNA binding protein
MSSTFSVRDLCERYGVGEHTVLAWIRSRELRAVNVGRKLGARRPRPCPGRAEGNGRRVSSIFTPSE